MAGDLQEVKENTNVTRLIVENVVEKQEDSRGTVVKRFKAVDDILKRMKECFDSTMSRELLDDFEPPDCIAQIRDYLRQKRNVIVTGTVGRSYLQVALAAIKDLNTHGPNVSAEISFPSDLRHIDPSEIKFILCTNPFGDHDFDIQKAREMLDVLCQIMKSAYAGELTLVIVTKKDVLVQAQEVFGTDHDVLQNIVVPYAETSVNLPEIIYSGSTTSCCTNCQRMPHSAIQEMSSCFLAQAEELPLRKSVFEEAKSTLKKERVVVLVGRNERLILSCIKQLAEQFAPNNCLVMSNPDDIKHLDAGAAMAVFLHITGQFAFDMSKSRRWFEYFDFIHALVKSNKLRVVLTFEQTSLKRCIDKIIDHELLKHKVTITYKDVEDSRVKREAKAEDELPSAGTSFPGQHVDSDVPRTASHLTDITVPFGSPFVYYDMTLLSYNRFLIISKDYVQLFILQKQTFTSSLYGQYLYSRVTRVSDTRAAVICDFGHTIKFISVPATDQMSLDGEINVDGFCKAVGCAGDRLFLSIKTNRNLNIKVIDLGGNVLKSIHGNYHYPTFETKWDLEFCSYGSHDVLVSYGDVITRYSKYGMEQESYHIENKNKDNYSLTSDGSGYLYRHDTGNCKVYQMSLESGSKTILLDKIWDVQTLVYCNMEDKLYVVKRKIDQTDFVMEVFKITK